MSKDFTMSGSFMDNETLKEILEKAFWEGWIQAQHMYQTEDDSKRKCQKVVEALME